jgi:hypothetical protein
MRTLSLSFLLPLLPIFALAQTILSGNGGFESGKTDWNLYVPGDSESKGCQFAIASGSGAHSGNACAELTSTEIARFCIGHTPVPLTSGERYRLTLWYRAGAQTEFAAKTAGISVRMAFRKGRDDVPGGKLQIGAEGLIVAGNPPLIQKSFPKEWTLLQVVIQAPPYVDNVSFDVFSYAKGSVYFDDFSFEKVDSTTPVTPIEGGKDYAKLTSAGGPHDPLPPKLPEQPGPITTDAEMIASLNLDFPGMEKVKAAVQTGRLPAIQEAYLEFRRKTSTARWKISPSERPASPTAESDENADLVLKHNVTSDVYHYGPKYTFMGKDFNWLHNPVAPEDPGFSNEFTYCVVARTEFWKHLADAYWKTGNEKYARAWVEQLLDFARKNPVDLTPWHGQATVWRTLDSATRMDNSWPYCYVHFRDSASFTPEAQWIYLRMMPDHAKMLERGLKDESRSGNWVTDECAGLYTIGALFPELKESPHWREVAINRLIVEFNRMIPPDGLEGELTPGYHSGALEQFRGPLDLARLNNLPIPDLFKDKILSMYRAVILIAQQNWQDVCTNDSWIINTKKMAQDGLKVGEDPLLLWAASGGKEGNPPPDSTCLPYAGFYAMRSGWDWNDFFLFFRAGPPGIGHEHQDMLEVVLRAWGNTLLLDPGTYTYDRSNWRRYVVGTPAHNTILVDGKWQHRPNNKPPLDTPVDNPWFNTPLFDYVSGTYNSGYQKNVYASIEFLPMRWEGPVDTSVSHTRHVLYLRPYYALLVDTLDGSGNHLFESHFHMDAPAAHVDSTTSTAFSDNPGKVNVGIYSLEKENLQVDIVQGQNDPILGWLPNEKRSIPTVRLTKKQEAPAIYATLLYPYRGEEPPHIEGKPIPTQPGLWAQALTTPREKIEIVLAKDDTPKSISFESALRKGAILCKAAGILIRQPAEQGSVYLGGWNMTSYKDNGIAFTLDKPAAVVVTLGDKPLFYNGGEQPATLTLTQPRAATIVLPCKNWVDENGQPEGTPTLFNRFIK